MEVDIPSQADRRSSTRSAILCAARTLFGRDGFGSVSLDHVATAAAVTKGAIYHHFTSKDALFHDVLVAEQQQLATSLTQPPSGDAVAMFSEVAKQYLRAVSSPETHRILFVDGPAILGWAQWRAIDQQVFGALVRSALALVRGADADAEELDRLASLMMGAITEAAILCGDASDRERAATEIAAALGILLRGLAR